MTKNKAYFFDMDGVLFDSMPHHAIAWEEVMKKHGLSFTLWLLSAVRNISNAIFSGYCPLCAGHILFLYGQSRLRLSEAKKM